jgi:hypothetical protein
MNDLAAGKVRISIGIDAGLEPGHKLDVYRETGGGKYLGTLTVTKSLEPKQAVCEFRPARNVTIEKLRPDELPRKGDTAGLIRLADRAPLDAERAPIEPVPLLPPPPLETERTPVEEERTPLETERMPLAPAPM